MPSTIVKRSKRRYRGNVQVGDQQRQKLFPDDSKKSYKEAVLWEQDTKTMLELEAKKIGSASLKVGTWANSHLADVKQRHSEKTFQEKRGAFARFFSEMDISPDLPVEEIKPSQCKKFLSQQDETRSGYAANKDRKNLATGWDWGRVNFEEEGWPSSKNPFRAVVKYSEERSPRYIPPQEDFLKVFALAKGQDRVLLLTFRHTAARRSELFKMTWSAVDFDKGLIRLSTKKRKNGTLEHNNLPMTSELQKALLDWKEQRSKMEGVDKEHVFICLDRTAFCEDYYGKPFTVRQHFLKRLCNRAGVKPFGFHGIRHLVATELYHLKFSVGEIQSVLRHKSPMTTTIYLHSLGIENVRNVLESALIGRMNDILGTENKKPLEVALPGAVCVRVLCPDECTTKQAT